MSLRCGLDRLLEDPSKLAGRRVAVLAHGPSVTVDLVPIHLALAGVGAAPALLLGPEHGYFGVEQDMVAAADARDPATGAAIRSLYGEHEGTLRPEPAVFDGVDLLVIDLQDVGSRYYTYAATGAWAAEVALEAGVEVWILDRPNPLGGVVIEGPPLEPGFDSFVGAFPMPVRHGLTVAELIRRHLRLVGGGAAAVWSCAGLDRSALASEWGRPFLAPSPNMPSFDTAVLYPGLCLLEATTLSEGRGTTRPFRLVGAPGFDPYRLAAAISALGCAGVVAIPTYFRPQFQKHAGQVCGGVELVVTDPTALASTAFGCRLVLELFAEHRRCGGDPASFWRAEAYEFVVDRPALDLLSGSTVLRGLVEGLDRSGLGEWIASWRAAEVAFAEDRVQDLVGAAA